MATVKRKFKDLVRKKKETKEVKIKNCFHHIFAFGKYKGESLDDIDDLQYLNYILDNVDFDSSCEDTNKFINNLEMRIDELG